MLTFIDIYFLQLYRQYLLSFYSPIKQVLLLLSLYNYRCYRNVSQGHSAEWKQDLTLKSVPFRAKAPKCCIACHPY